MNIGQIMKQAQAMQEKMMKFQEGLGDVELDGQAGAGLVKATLNGKGELKRVAIDASLLVADEKETLEDLIVAAFNDGKRKVDERVAEETGKMMGGMGLPPGMKLPF